MRSRSAIGIWPRALALLGLAIIGLALFAPQLRRPDGCLDPIVRPIGIAGLSLMILAAGLGTAWQRCAGLLALALVGQACALEMIFAPPYNILQRYLPWKQLLASGKCIFLIGLLAQTVITVRAARALLPAMLGCLSRALSLQRLLFLLAIMGFAGANFSRDPARYAGELVLAGWAISVNLLNLVLVAAAVPGDALRKAFRWAERELATGSEADRGRWDRLLPWLAAAWATTVAALLARFVFEGVPHIPDDVSYLFQAKYFAAGRLYLPAPPDAESFAISHTISDGTKWYGYGSPGWPAVLALGVLAGAPWLVNPLLGGLAVLLLHALVCRLYGRALAHAAVLLLAVSPWFLFMSASFMTHSLSLVLTLLALLALDRAQQAGRAMWGAAAGACLGALALTRPLEGILIGALFGLLVLGIAGERLPARALLAFALAAAAVGGLNLPYNYLLTGRATYPPIAKFTDEKWYPGANRLGFGPDIGNVGWQHLDPLPGHGPLDVLINANQNFYMINFDLYGWSFGSLLFALLVLLWGHWCRADRLFLGLAATIILGHSFYWFSGGPDIGARYWYLVLVPLVILTARGAGAVQQKLIELGAAQPGLPRVGAFIAAASLAAAINFIPWRCLEKYHHYRGISADIGRLARNYGFDNALVFVRDQNNYNYASAFIFNPPTLDSPGTIYALDAGPAHRRIVEQRFPNRPIWFIGPSPADDSRLQVLAGPLLPRDQ